MNKQQMIDRLVTDALLHAGFDDSARAGSRDFAKMPERLLERELQFRGLLDFDEPDPFDIDDADDGVFGDELRTLVSRAGRLSLDNHFFD